MSGDEILTEDEIETVRQVGRVEPEAVDVTQVTRSHEALRAERDLFRGLAMRHIDGWHPQFHVDPAKCVWVSNWPGNPDELMTAAEVEWYRQRREART